jgi:hypothetical protein
MPEDGAAAVAFEDAETTLCVEGATETLLETGDGYRTVKERCERKSGVLLVEMLEVDDLAAFCVLGGDSREICISKKCGLTTVKLVSTTLYPIPHRLLRSVVECKHTCTSS